MKQLFKKVNVNKDALQKARDLYSENKSELENYLDHLLEWNEKINLVSRTVSRETVREHVVHSLLPLVLGLTYDFDQWLDAGTGGGLPGIPLAICEKDKKWILNDNVRKKMRAVSQITEALNLQNTEIEAKSISLITLKKGTGIVTKHAFKISDLLKMLGSQPWKKIIMWKGVAGAIEELKEGGRVLNVTIYTFEFGENEPFYEGKGLVKIER